MLPESSSRPLPATLAQSRNLAHASLETAAIVHVLTLECSPDDGGGGERALLEVEPAAGQRQLVVGGKLHRQFVALFVVVPLPCGGRENCNSLQFQGCRSGA